MKRKILSLILVFAMTVSLFTVGTGAVEPTYGDTAGHWAESSIERWSGHGIIQGSNGQFDPNGQLTCAQLATILAKLLKLPAAKDAGFTDNTADAWYYDAINRCAAAGILNGNGDGTVTPEAPITRERAMVMLARALGIEPIRKPDLTKYTDAAQVSAYAQGYVAALIEAGIVGGVTADELAPQDNINRASTVTILDRAISTYADKAGATVKADGKGLVLAVADDVTITGEVNKLLVPANDIEVTVKGSKNIDDIVISGDNSKVILDNASADNVTLDGEKSAVETKNGAKIDNVIVTENAPGATVDVGSGTTVGNVENHAEDATVTGNGTVKKVESDKDITVKTKDTDVKNIGDEKITVTDKSGKDTTIGTTGSGSSTTVNKGTTSSGGGGYSHSHSYDTSKWVFDDTTHWHASTCGHNLKIDEAEHTYENDVCIVCGQVKADVAVAKIGNQNYKTLAEAIGVATDGDTVTLVKDISNFAGVTIAKDLTIDFGTYTLIGAVGVTVIKVQNAVVTLNGTTGGINGGNGGNNVAIWASDDCTINITGGNYTVGGDANDSGNSTVYVVGNGKVNISGGTFSSEKTYRDKYYVLNLDNSATGSISVTGGTFVGQNPGGGDDYLGGTFLAEGYKAVENGDGTWVVRKKENNAQVGGKNYEELSDAIEASNSNDNTITLTKNTTVKLENGVANGSEKSRNITIKGDGTQTVDVITRAIGAEGGMLSYQRGSTFTFENVTVQAGEGNFDGIVCDELVYNNCTIKGKLTLYGKATFSNCTFENEMANQYSIWTWGGTDVKFEGCTFNTNGKAILLYGQATAEKPTNLTVRDCTFNDRNNGSAGKAAIEIGNDYNATYSLTVTSATVNGFADGKNTGSKIWANKNSMNAKHLTVIIDNKYVLGTEAPKQTVTVTTAARLKKELTTLTSAGSRNNVINIDGDFQLADGETWEPVTVDGYNGAGVITINGNSHTIKGLNAPLIAGGFAGKSGVVIKDLTLENVTINDTTSNQGIGAFIGNVDSMPQIELNNCHLKSSTITSTGGARVGGLIGWTSGYNKQDDGPVDTHISITNCSVEDCTIRAKGSVGAIIGHAGADPATYHTITGCTVKDCALTSTDDGGWRVGVVVGTANVGEVTIKNITTDNNTVRQTGKTAPEGQSDLYGRFVPGETGKLTIDNIEIK